MRRGGRRCWWRTATRATGGTGWRWPTPCPAAGSRCSCWATGVRREPRSPSETGLASDARAGWAHLTGLGFAPGRIVLFGESLGGGVVTGLATGLVAAGTPPGGLVLRSPFVSLAAVGRAHYPFLPVGTLLRDRYPVAEQVSRISVPTVVVYGTADTVVPPAQSRAVADRASTLVAAVPVEGADHNDAALAAGPAIVDAVVSLTDRLSG